MAEQKTKYEIEYRYKGNKGRVFGMTTKEKANLPNEVAAFIYKDCEGCKLKTGKLNILGGHCSTNGVLEIKNKKCTSKK